MYELRATFESNSFTMKRTNIVPHGCVIGIHVNEKGTSLSHISKRKLCDNRDGFEYDFEPHLIKGRNDITIQIQKKGRFYGLELRPIEGTVYFAINGLIILLIFVFLFLMSKNLGARYSVVLLPFVIAYGYTVLRFQMNIEYSGATWDQLYDFIAPKPFGHRIFVPLISRPLVQFWGMSVRNAYIFYEFLFTLFTIVTLNGVFRLYLDKRTSYFLSILFVVFMSLPYLLEYKWPVYYPYDMASNFFMVAGLYLVVKQNWLVLMIAMVLGSLNRETMIMLIPMFILLKMDQLTLKKQLAIIVALATFFLCARLLVSLGLPDNIGDAAHFYVGKKLRVLNNIGWLLDKPVDNSIQFLASICYVPLLWIISRKFMPHEFKRLEVWSVLFFAPLFVVGNVYEPRIFGEIIAVLYVPIMLGIVRQLGRQVDDLSVATECGQWLENPRLNRFFYKTVSIFDKYGFAATCVILMIFILAVIRLHESL